MGIREDIERAALEYLDTPFIHQGRVKGAGIDCAGLIVCVLRDVGINVPDVPAYSRMPHGVLQPILEQHCRKTSTPKPGDIYLFKVLHEPQHLAFATTYGMIHAWQPAKKVVHHRFDKHWNTPKRLVAAYCLKEVGNG